MNYSLRETQLEAQLAEAEKTLKIISEYQASGGAAYDFLIIREEAKAYFAKKGE